VLSLIDRKHTLFPNDLDKHEDELGKIIPDSSFLVIGGAGSIGQAVTKEIFKRNPKILHVVDISENNLVELVRDARSTIGYGSGEFRTFAIGCGSVEFEALFNVNRGYDYVFNLSALKHVRSEKDPFTLMRMTTVNILNTLKSVQLARQGGARKYFCVSTDKAANPVNMMGASKRIMEKFLFNESLSQKISMARFANVAFSDGSLLHGFNQRIAKRQPITAPDDVQRYFLTPQESGELCLLSGLLGENREIFVPKLSKKLHLISFSEIAVSYLKQLGYVPHLCQSEDEARNHAEKLIATGKWPCYFFKSDTTGEKKFEEFYTDKEVVDFARFEGIGVIKNRAASNDADLKFFLTRIEELRQQGVWTKEDILSLYLSLVPEFSHTETDKNLDQRM
jgi:FlaA1/EpsC-like NDP-sugar epimerase